MQLPPERQNEPEWLQVQRGRLKSEKNWTYSGLAAMAFASAVYAILDALAGSPGPTKVFGIVGFCIAAPLTIIAIVVARRTNKGTYKRSFAMWSVVTHGLFAVAFFATALRWPC